MCGKAAGHQNTLAKKEIRNLISFGFSFISHTGDMKKNENIATFERRFDSIIARFPNMKFHLAHFRNLQSFSLENLVSKERKRNYALGLCLLIFRKKKKFKTHFQNSYELFISYLHAPTTHFFS